MEQLTWILWAVFGVCLIIAEIFTLGFFILWFGVGALAAGAAAFLGFGIGWQFAVFAFVSIILTVTSRTIFADYLNHNDEDSLKTGAASMPGKIGTVTIASRGALNEAAVKVFGSTWTAFPEDGETELVEGEKVEIVRVEGSSIYVRRWERELPEWRGERGKDEK